MGIGPAVGSWLANLHDRGIFAKSTSVIEMGPSEFNWPKPTLAVFLKKNFRSKEAAARNLVLMDYLSINTDHGMFA